MVNGISSCGPEIGSPWLTAGTPGGFARVWAGAGGACGSRPSRPATYGRVDGFTANRNRPPGALYTESSTSVYCSGGPTVPSLLITGDVGVENCLWTRSVTPFGALPSIVECRALFAVAASMVK